MWYFMDFGNASCLCFWGHYRAGASTWKPPKPGRKKKSDEIYRYSRDNGQRPLRALSLLMALLLAGCIFWDPSRFAANQLEIWHGFLLMWAVCRRYSRRGLSPACRSLAGDFCPLIADIVLALGLFFSSLNKRSLLMLWACISP